MSWSLQIFCAALLGCVGPILRGQTAPIILTQPASQSVPVTGPASLTVGASGSGTLSYQWLKDGLPIATATSATFAISHTQASDQGAYQVIVANSVGTVESNPAVLTVLAPPVIVTPVITSSATVISTTGAAFRYTITASTQPTQFTTTALPSGLSLDSLNGVIAGVPAGTGVYSVTITASNAAGAGAPFTLSITLTAPVIEPIVSTVAGGTAGSAAQFSGPGLIAADAAGNVFIADTGSATIRKVGIGGITTTIAGLSGDAGSTDGVASAARFSSPTGVAVDQAGNLYVTDTGNNTIRKISPQGVTSTVAGLAGSSGSADGLGAAARFKAPTGIAVDSTGTLFVSDTGNNTIRKISSSGSVTTLAGLAPLSGYLDAFGVGARFNSPSGIVVDPSGNVYVNDVFNERIRKISAAGAVSTLAALPIQGQPTGAVNGLTLDSSGNLYASSGPATYVQYISFSTNTFTNTLVAEISSTGLVSTINGWSGQVASRLGPTGYASTTATGVTVNPSGGIYEMVNGALQSVIMAEVPYIVTDPVDQTSAVGATVTLSAAAMGFPSLSYQWLKNGVAIVGATTSQLTFDHLLLTDAGSYSVRVTTPAGSTASRAASLSVSQSFPSFAITTQPQSQNVIPGTASAFTVAVNQPDATVQWFKNGVALPGAAALTLTIPVTQLSDAGVYSAIVSNAGQSIESQMAVLGVNAAPGASYLTQWSTATPLSSTVLYTSLAYDGTNFLTVGSDGSLFRSSDATTWTQLPALAGRLNSLINVGAPYGLLGVGDNGVVVTFAAPNYTPAYQSTPTNSLLTGVAVGSGRMVAVGFGGTAITSDFASPGWVLGYTGVNNNLNAVAYGNGLFVAVGGGPVLLTSSDGFIWTQQSLSATDTLFSVAYGASGFVAISSDTIFTSVDGVRWYSRAAPAGIGLIRVIYANGLFVAVGSNGAVVTSADGGYSWAVHASGSSATLEGVSVGDSRIVAVGGQGTVAESASAYVRLVNLSTHALVGGGGYALSAGYFSGGSDNKQILLRGIGPSLATFGIPGVLNNPQLKLFDADGGAQGSNSAWGGSESLAELFLQVGAFSLPRSSVDTAILIALPFGRHTAQLTSTDGSSGVGMIEVYDADPGSPTARLTNLSSLGYAGIGTNAMVAGFVIEGNAPEKVLIRGIGPGLGAFGLSGLLASPSLTLYDNGGNLLATNTAWGGTDLLATTFTAVGAFGLQPTSNDTALLVTLGPGIYTAQVSGVNSNVGAAILELYEVP